MDTPKLVNEVMEIVSSRHPSRGEKTFAPADYLPSCVHHTGAGLSLNLQFTERCPHFIMSLTGSKQRGAPERASPEAQPFFLWN